MKKWSFFFFPKQNSYVHWDHKPNSIKTQQSGKGWQELSGREGGSAVSRVQFGVSPQWHQKRKGKKGKKKEMKENCKFFLVTILKRAKFLWEIGHERCEAARKEGRTFVCKCSMKVGMLRQKHCDQRRGFQWTEWTVCCFSKAHCAQDQRMARTL